MARASNGRGPEAGFTLLELLISMSLLVVMMAMTYSVFQTAMTAVPRGEEAAERSARLRMATSLLTRQVRSLVDYPAETEDDIYTFFVGDEQNLSFITAAPQLGGGEGLGWVTYSTDGEALVMAERLIFSAGVVAGDEPEEASEAILLAGLSGARFEYLRLDGPDAEWLDAWDAAEELNPPAAIRVTLAGLGIDDSYWVQEIPVMTVVYALGAYDSDVGLGSDGDVFGAGFDEDDDDDF